MIYSTMKSFILSYIFRQRNPVYIGLTYFFPLNFKETYIFNVPNAFKKSGYTARAAL